MFKPPDMFNIIFAALCGGVVVIANTVQFNSMNSSRANGEIVFPNPEYSPANNKIGKGINHDHEGSKGLPLHILKALGSGDQDFAQVVKKLVGNARVETSFNGEEFLADSNGNPLTDKRGKRIYIGGENNGTPLKTKFTVLGLPNEPKTNSSTPLKTIPLSGRMGAKPLSTVDKGWSAAICKPEEQTVSLQVNFEPHIIYYPRCVRVERCGGCCASDILACEPRLVTTVDVPVQKYEYISEKLNFIQQEYIPVERHTKCECGCRIKAKDCNPLQVYRESECLCVCANNPDQEACSNNGLKVWDWEKCLCSCREIRDCNSGFYFNLASCDCLSLSSMSSKNRLARVYKSSRGRNLN